MRQPARDETLNHRGRQSENTNSLFCDNAVELLQFLTGSEMRPWSQTEEAVMGVGELVSGRAALV